jgi:hypothetical protein
MPRDYLRASGTQGEPTRFNSRTCPSLVPSAKIKGMKRLRQIISVLGVFAVMGFALAYDNRTGDNQYSASKGAVLGLLAATAVIAFTAWRAKRRSGGPD